MTGRFIVHVIAVIGWLFAAVFAYAFLTLFGYFGVGFYGLLLLFICMQVELEPDAGLAHHQRSPGRYGLLFGKIFWNRADDRRLRRVPTVSIGLTSWQDKSCVPGRGPLSPIRARRGARLRRGKHLSRQRHQL